MEVTPKPPSRIACPIKGCAVTAPCLAALVRHSRAHSGERPFRCAVCPKAFARRSGVTRHQQVHCKYWTDAPYKCKVCVKSFAFKFSRARHEATMHA